MKKNLLTAVLMTIVTTVLLGSTLSHQVGASTEKLSNPDDIVTLGARLFVGFQNGVGSLGQASGTGNTATTLVEFTQAGDVLHQWDLTGRIDGMATSSS